MRRDSELSNLPESVARPEAVQAVKAVLGLVAFTAVAALSAAVDNIYKELARRSDR